MKLQWEAPSDDGGVGVSSYSVTMTEEGTVFISYELTYGTSQDVYLQYNRDYVFEVAATNCNGTGQHSSSNITAGNRLIYTVLGSACTYLCFS